MVNPRTVNAGIIVPLTGADVDTWGEVDVNPNMVAIDGYLAGIQAIALAGTDYTLTKPSSFTATPTPGPTEAQNRVLTLTGLLTNSIVLKLPLPGVYVIDNRTTGLFDVRISGLTSTEVIAIEQGSCRTVYNDGANVRFMDMPSVGTIEMWAGLDAIPSWVTWCTKAPFLLCDGAVYNFSDYPYLAQRLKGKFGGNGISTFAVPDLRGRVALPYDGTGARITAAGGAGFNGQTIGAAGGNQGSQLLNANLPPYTPSGSITGTASSQQTNIEIASSNITVNVGGANTVPLTNPQQITVPAAGLNFSGNAQGGSSAIFSNTMPSQVTGISVIKT